MSANFVKLTSNTDKNMTVTVKAPRIGKAKKMLNPDKIAQVLRPASCRVSCTKKCYASFTLAVVTACRLLCFATAIVDGSVRTFSLLTLSGCLYIIYTCTIIEIALVYCQYCPLAQPRRNRKHQPIDVQS
jgi:hypothetical protein